MQNPHFWLRPFIAAVFGVIFLSSVAIAARDGSTDRPGLDYKTIELSAPNPDLCENACKKDGQCRAWTYSWPGAKGPKAMCALKTGVPPKRSDTCCISGVLSTSGPVTRTDDPAPAPAKPAVSAKPAPTRVPPKPAITARPVPTPAPRKPTVVEKSAPEKPARQTIVKPLPVPPPPRADQERITVLPKPKPSLRPLPQDESGQQETTGQTQPDSAKVAACNNYATRALVQNDENNRLNCRLSGSLWGYTRSTYFNFCMRSPSSAYNGSRAARDNELDRCKRQVATREQSEEETVLPEPEANETEELVADDTRSGRFCRNFAGQSIRQVRQARLSKCGFEGERWSSSRVRQTQLCTRIGPREATTLLNTRNQQIRNCRLSASRRDRPVSAHCRQYARAAVQQVREARALDCGFGGRRWSGSYERHLRWCSNVSRRKARREHRKRERQLDRCE